MLQNNPENDPLAEKLIDSGIAYKGSFLQLHKDTVKTPDGVVTTREYLHHPGASMIIPMFEDGTVNANTATLCAEAFSNFPLEN